MINHILQRHEIHAISQPVTDIESQVLPHIERMKALCNQRIGNYPGAVALAHCQVERDNPLTFFVFSGGEAVVNPVIIMMTDKFMNVEGCLSIALRPQKYVKRFNQINASYTSVKDGVIKEFSSIVETGQRACVFQHEMDHFRNKYIY